MPDGRAAVRGGSPPPIPAGFEGAVVCGDLLGREGIPRGASFTESAAGSEVGAEGPSASTGAGL